MTITVKPLAAVLAIAVLGVLAGLAIGQVTQAQSARGGAEVAQLKKIKRSMAQLNRKLGATYKASSAIGALDDIRLGLEQDLTAIEHNTEETCEEIKQSVVC